MRLLTVLEAIIKDFTPKLYHFTTEDNLLKILATDSLIASEPDSYYLELDKRLKSSKKQRAISLTRDKGFDPSGMNIGNPEDIGSPDYDPQKNAARINVMIVLNADRIKQRYKIEPFNYDALDKFHGIPVTKNKESEERVMTDKIPNLHRYILNIEYKGSNPEIIKMIDDYEENIKRKKEEIKKNPEQK